jgi:hypothetical protein
MPSTWPLSWENIAPTNHMRERSARTSAPVAHQAWPRAGIYPKADSMPAALGPTILKIPLMSKGLLGSPTGKT